MVLCFTYHMLKVLYTMNMKKNEVVQTTQLNSIQKFSDKKCTPQSVMILGDYLFYPESQA